MAHVAVTVLWALVLWVSTFIQLTGSVLGWAVSAHIFGVVLALGPIVLLDWYGLVWVAGLRRLRECLRIAEAAHPVIWTGLWILLLSGMFLQPDLTSATTWVKQLFVLALLHNGVALKPLERRLMKLPADVTNATLPSGLRARMMGATMLSQVCWWGAFGIGCLVLVSRHLA